MLTIIFFKYSLNDLIDVHNNQSINQLIKKEHNQPEFLFNKRAPHLYIALDGAGLLYLMIN